MAEFKYRFSKTICILSYPTVPVNRSVVQTNNESFRFTLSRYLYHAGRNLPGNHSHDPRAFEFLPAEGPKNKNSRVERMRFRTSNFGGPFDSTFIINIMNPKIPCGVDFFPPRFTTLSGEVQASLVRKSQYGPKYMPRSPIYVAGSAKESPDAPHMSNQVARANGHSARKSKK